MPTAPSDLELLPEAISDIDSIKSHNPDHAERIFNKIEEWEDHIQWGRVPQEHLTHLSDARGYSFYRQWVGQSGYRVIYEISGDVMRVVGVRPKGDDTYDMEEFIRRMERASE